MAGVDKKLQALQNFVLFQRPLILSSTPIPKVTVTSNQSTEHHKPRLARENAGDQDAIGFGFASDWLRRWREFSDPITERCAF